MIVIVFNTSISLLTRTQVEDVETNCPLRLSRSFVMNLPFLSSKHRTSRHSAPLTTKVTPNLLPYGRCRNYGGKWPVQKKYQLKFNLRESLHGRPEGIQDGALAITLAASDIKI